MSTRDTPISAAIAMLEAGKLVAFPTETVYGLGADATNADAVARIFKAKGRPSTNPLICHVADEEIARRYTRVWPLAASRIVDAFWPGPITIVLPKTDEIPSIVSAGLDSVGLRAPDHPLTLELLAEFDKPLAGPSANRSMRVSPTNAKHVRDELGPAVDLVIDGGKCAVGIESTVLDLTGERFRILRPGAITRKMIEQTLHESVDVAELHSTGTEAMQSPGQMSTHYAPITPAFRFEPRDRDLIDVTDAAIIEVTLDAESYAKNFYARLRLLDSQSLRAIYIELPPDTEAWRAVRDRIMRATKQIG